MFNDYAPRLRFPKGWRGGRTVEQIEHIRTIERYSSAGLFIIRGPDAKGYMWVRLCVGHPYANKYGWQRLHRYLMMRVLGRRLEWYEHVHHEGDDKATTDIRKLSLTMADDHGRLHYARRLSKGGRHVPLWWPRDKATGRFTKYPTEEILNENIEAAAMNGGGEPIPF